MTSQIDHREAAGLADDPAHKLRKKMFLAPHVITCVFHQKAAHNLCGSASVTY